MESDQLHVPAVFLSFHSVNHCFYSARTEQNPLQQFFRIEFVTAVSVFFCAEKGPKLGSPDPLMGSKATHRRQTVCQCIAHKALNLLHVLSGSMA